MCADGPGRTDSVRELLSTLSSSNAKLVCLYLRTVGGATIGEMERDLQLPKLTLFAVLRTLYRRGLVRRTDDRYAIV